MTVMDIKVNTGLTPEQVNLAHGFKHTTLATLKAMDGDCTFPVVALHYDLVETAVRALGITGHAQECFQKLAKLPEGTLTV